MPDSVFPSQLSRHSAARASRRAFLGLAGLSLAGCALPETELRLPDSLQGHYDARMDGGHRVASVTVSWIEPRYLRAVVPNRHGVAPGEILVMSADHHLYYGLDADRAIRYGVTLGAEGADWRGAGYIARKSEWPTWTPTPRMIAETPQLSSYAGGMPGGAFNPLGARALYIYANGKDTLYRVHGTHMTWRIGQDHSSGCVRMFNQDVIDLYEKVAVGARITVV